MCNCMRVKCVLMAAAVCAITCALLVITALTGGHRAYAADTTVTASGTCGDDLTWKLTSDGTLTISGTGEMDDYDYYDSSSYGTVAPWEDEKENITTVVIGTGVTSIGDYEFYKCSNLKSIKIPEGVTSIGEFAFGVCSDLTSVKIPSSVTGIGDNAFYGCSSLKSIKIPSGLTRIRECVFCGCSGLTCINIPVGVTRIDWGAFEGCSSLKSINIPKGVTSIGNAAFYECSSLTSINIPSGVKSINNSTFGYCSSLLNIKLPSSVTKIDGFAFESCSSLVSIKLPSNVTRIGDCAFASCSSLKSINIPSSVTSIKYGAFDGCSSLKTIYGTSGSYAEKYANKNGYKFVAVVMVSGGSNGSLSVKWPKYTGAKKYVVYRKTSGGSWKQLATVSKSKTSYIDKSAKSGIRYKYLVKAYTGSKYVKVGSASDFVMILTTPSVTVTPDTNGFKLMWRKTSNTKGYVIYRKAKGDSWTRVKTLAGSALAKCTSNGNVSCTDKTVKSGKKYSYRVQAYGGASKSKMKATAYLMYMKSPTVKVSLGSSGIKVRWSRTAGAKEYKVYRKADGDTGFKLVKRIRSGSAVTFTDKKAESGKSYKYCVVAYSGENYSGSKLSKSITR